jgi:two-component system LytT family response regulator
MIRTIIIDDEQHCIDRLAGLLSEHCKYSVNLIGAFHTVDDGLKAIEELQPELVFLDVQIGSDTGFNLLQRLKKISFEVIFSTAYDKYAVNAFKFSALDYLLKPVDPDDLQQAVEKFRNKNANHEMEKKFETLFHNLKTTTSASKKISVATISGFEFINVSDILRCQSDVNYTTIFMKDKKQLMVAKTLKEFEELLTEYNFFRVHNSHLINLAYIKSYAKGKGGYVKMNDDSEIEVSTRRKEDFLKKLAEI